MSELTSQTEILPGTILMVNDGKTVGLIKGIGGPKTFGASTIIEVIGPSFLCRNRGYDLQVLVNDVNNVPSIYSAKSAELLANCIM